MFTNKQNSTFNPYTYFDQKAIDRRIKTGISLYDSTDFPVNTHYINEVSDLVDSTNIITRWFNGISVIATDEQIAEVEKLSFVRKIQPIYLQTYITSYDTFLTESDSNLIRRQLEIMQGQKFIDNGITGKGVRIAIFDAGFPNADNNPVFAHLRKNNQIIKTYDFAKKKDYVYKFNHHGTMTFSCIAGMTNGMNIGLATGAEFLLARTEIATEPFSEEENWLAAAEWADKNGADIISSSLGYTVPRYFQYQMDGTTFVAKAATMASDKGILVVNAMGNDGDASWKVVGTPADAPKVLSVGGVDPETCIHINFSSFGPTADGHLKPELCASGKGLVASTNDLTVAYGTSFATPFITGFAACALQTNDTLTNMQLKEELIKSANLYPYFDYAHGYGIPQAGYFTDAPKPNTDTTFSCKISSNIAKIEIKIPIDSLKNENNYFFYHFRYENGKIAQYGVKEITQQKFDIDIPQKSEPLILMIFYKNFTKEIKIK